MYNITNYNSAFAIVGYANNIELTCLKGINTFVLKFFTLLFYSAACKKIYIKRHKLIINTELLVIIILCDLIILPL